MVKPVGRESHYRLVHPVLHLQQCHSLRFVLYYTLHKGLVKSTLHCSNTLDSWRQLAVIAGKYHSRCPAYGYPAGCLKSLGSLINEERTEFHSVEQSVGTAHESTCYHPCLSEYLRPDAQVKFYLTLLQAF